MKKCFKCEIVKPLEDYYKHQTMSDGHGLIECGLTVDLDKIKI